MREHSNSTSPHLVWQTPGWEKWRQNTHQGLFSTESSYVSCPKAPHVKIVSLSFESFYTLWGSLFFLIISGTQKSVMTVYPSVIHVACSCSIFFFFLCVSFLYFPIAIPPPPPTPSKMTGASIPDITVETMEKHFQWFGLFIFWLCTGLGSVTVWEKRDSWSELLDGQDVVFILFYFFPPWQPILCLTFFLTHLSYAFLFCQKKEKFDISTKWYLYCCNWTERNKIPDWWISEGI